MQTVSITLRVLSHPDEEKLAAIYSNLGLDFDDRVLPSIGNEVNCKKQFTARFSRQLLLNLMRLSSLLKEK
jgi:prohibitin 1